jgi:cell division septal protein FtsQ
VNAHGWLGGSRAFRRRERILERRQERAARHEVTDSAAVRSPGLLGRILALFALLGVSGLLYDVAASPDFRARQVSVSGNHLLSGDEVLGAAALQGANVFWIRRSEVAARVRRLPAARGVEVRVSLPGRVELIVDERTPYVSWQSGDAMFLVDREGLVLSPRPPDQPLVIIHDIDGSQVAPGSRVDQAALRTVSALSQSLPKAVGIEPTEYDYSRALGIEVPTPEGTRLRFGGDDSLEAKVATLVALRARLAQDGSRPSVIDLRFPSRPYFR